MGVRNKLLLVMAVPIGLVALQILLVTMSIRQLQDAVNFISSATTVIETNFIAIDNLAPHRPPFAIRIRQNRLGRIGRCQQTHRDHHSRVAQAEHTHPQH